MLNHLVLRNEQYCHEGNFLLLGEAEEFVSSRNTRVSSVMTSRTENTLKTDKGRLSEINATKKRGYSSDRGGIPVKGSTTEPHRKKIGSPNREKDEAQHISIRPFQFPGLKGISKVWRGEAKYMSKELSEVFQTKKMILKWVEKKLRRSYELKKVKWLLC